MSLQVHRQLDATVELVVGRQQRGGYRYDDRGSHNEDVPRHAPGPGEVRQAEPAEQLDGNTADGSDEAGQHTRHHATAGGPFPQQPDDENRERSCGERAETDMVFLPHLSATAVEDLRAAGLDAELSMLEVSGGHLDGLMQIDQAEARIRQFLESDGN